MEGDIQVVECAVEGFPVFGDAYDGFDFLFGEVNEWCPVGFAF